MLQRLGCKVHLTSVAGTTVKVFIWLATTVSLVAVEFYPLKVTMIRCGPQHGNLVVLMVTLVTMVALSRSFIECDVDKVTSGIVLSITDDVAHCIQ